MVSERWEYELVREVLSQLLRQGGQSFQGFLLGEVPGVMRRNIARPNDEVELEEHRFEIF